MKNEEKLGNKTGFVDNLYTLMWQTKEPVNLELIRKQIFKRPDFKDYNYFILYIEIVLL